MQYIKFGPYKRMFTKSLPQSKSSFFFLNGPPLSKHSQWACFHIHTCETMVACDAISLLYLFNYVLFIYQGLSPSDETSSGTEHVHRQGQRPNYNLNVYSLSYLFIIFHSIPSHLLRLIRSRVGGGSSLGRDVQTSLGPVTSSIYYIICNSFNGH